MMDPRIKKLADILVDYSIKVKKGNLIVINCSSEAGPLVLECFKLILKKGAYPKVNVSLPRFAYTYYKLANFVQLNRFPKLAMIEAKMADGEINIGGGFNTKELSNIAPMKMAIRNKVLNPISEVMLKKGNWVGCVYPTNAWAQDAEMSLEEFEDFAFKAMLLDWKKESKKQDKLKQLLDRGKTVKIVADDTYLTFSIEGRQGAKCDGKHNMPDGEVFIAPVETTTEGYIRYSYPVIRGGREVSDVTLEFKKGAVVKAKAVKNEKFLKAMIKTDKGAKYIGEFGIGLNTGIQKFIKQILFDEKIFGTIHLALGRAYEEGGGKNVSAIHWDMIKDLRKGGSFYIDNNLIQKNGKFMISL